MPATDLRERIEAALRRHPRTAFLPPEDHASAEEDAPVPIGEGQTCSAPHMVRIMLEALDVQPGHRVLEVGGGSGWHAALLADLAFPGGRVVTMERHESLARAARRRLEARGLPVDVLAGDGSLGAPDRAPFDRISVAAAAPHIPEPLVEQLALGGIMVLPVGPLDWQELLRVTRESDGTVRTEPLGTVRFVPLVGAHGYSPDAL